MKNLCSLLVAVLLFIAQFSYAGGSSDNKTTPTPTATTPVVSGLLSLDEAIEAAAVAIEGRIAGGSEIVVYKITASNDAIGDYIAEYLNDRISMRGNLVPLAREAALQSIDTEQQFQMSGFVSNASAVGIGHYLGAKVVITGTFDRYADFSQLRLRAIDVQTSALLYSYSARINNNDRVLANISAPFGNIQAPRITENALDCLNSGKDFYAEGRLDEAIREFDRAIAINANLTDAYFIRGLAYYGKQDYDRVIADFTQVIRIDPNDASAYFYRGNAYYNKQDYDRAIADYTQTIRINPNHAGTYNNRGFAYYDKQDYDRAIADYTQAIRINPNYARAYNNRGLAYYNKQDYDRAIADYTQAIRIDPNYTYAYYNRGLAYGNKGDYDRAIADYTQAIRINPNDAALYNSRGWTYALKGDYDQAIVDANASLRIRPNDANTLHTRGYAYLGKRDYDRAIADFEAALRIDPNNTDARQDLERARQERGR
ncbi:MAG: tetratricopeptide repeat protein [Treponema sp.]|nr:tetratricopeptide repeat protein [Treponema sp.]